MNDGYYWARKDPASEWEIIEVSEEFAWRSGMDEPWLVSDFFEIDPRPITRQPQNGE